MTEFELKLSEYIDLGKIKEMSQMGFTIIRRLSQVN
jgi:hypothetical protein